jgi:D-glycero-alpha-D-manno-heptose-7-phosphate kinase
MAKLVDEGERILTTGRSILDFGRLLDYTWKLKRTLSSKITTGLIDNLYAKAIKAGAIGGKLLGAGGGGFILLFVEPDKQCKVKKALYDLLNVPFQFETSGTKVIYYKPNIKEIGVVYNEKKGADYRHDRDGRIASR